MTDTPDLPELPADKDKDERLLPARVFSKWNIIAWAIVPQLFLLFLNWRNYSLISGDASPEQKTVWFTAMGLEVLLLGFFIGGLVFLQKRGKEITKIVALIGLVPPAAFIAYSFFPFHEAIPRGAQLWILPPETVIIDQATWMMPAILYALLVLAAHPVRTLGRELCISVAAIISLALLWALASEGHLSDKVLLPLLATFFPIIGIAIFYAMMKTLIHIYLGMSKARATGPGASRIDADIFRTFCGVLAIALPLLGLMINDLVPFPYDFQSPLVYLLTVVNGIALTLPNFRSVLARRALWLAQLILLPFSLYFFITFMPFLPMSVPGMIVWGGGLLVLIPSVVLMLHTLRLIDGFKTEMSEGHKVMATAGLAATLVLPLLFVGGAVRDRTVVQDAVDFVYNDDFATDRTFPHEPSGVARTLNKLKSFKEGLRLPYLTSTYNQIAFDGLILPDSKMKKLSSAFVGKELEIQPNSNRNFFGRGSAFSNIRRGDPPHTDVSLKLLQATHHIDDLLATSLVAVPMQNNLNSQGEFKTSITLPEDVIISGFWLHIGDERVPGKLFEKKSAMWVYKMIRDIARRDPGVLRYTAPNTVELRVFPLQGHEHRKVEIEFLYPRGDRKTVQIGAQTVALEQRDKYEDAVLAWGGETGTSVSLADEALAQLPQVKRTPYLHFLVNHAQPSKLSAEQLGSAIEAARSVVPEATLGRVTLANFAFTEVGGPELQKFDALRAAAVEAHQSTTKQGGFLPERTLKRALFRYDRDFREAEAGDSLLTHYPVYMLLNGDGTAEVDPAALPDMAYYSALVPEMAALYQYRSDQWSSAPWQNATQDVAILRLGGRNAIVPRNRGTQLSHFDHPPTAEKALAACASTTDSFDPLEAKWVEKDSRYLTAMDAVRRQRLATLNPGRTTDSLYDLVHLSKDTGVLLDSTTYIVVESHAQWEMLERSEKKKLKANKAMDMGEDHALDSVPEPSTSLLLLISSAFLIMHRRR